MGREGMVKGQGETSGLEFKVCMHKAEGVGLRGPFTETRSGEQQAEAAFRPWCSGTKPGLEPPVQVLSGESPQQNLQRFRAPS